MTFTVNYSLIFKLLSKHFTKDDVILVSCTCELCLKYVTEGDSYPKRMYTLNLIPYKLSFLGLRVCWYLSSSASQYTSFKFSFTKLSQNTDLFSVGFYCYSFHLSLHFWAKMEFSVTLLPNLTLTISLNVKILSEV